MSDLRDGSKVGGSPPRIPERLLTAVLRDPRVREDVLGDLHAAYQKYERQSRFPGLRYWIAALDVGTRFLLPHRATGSPAPRSPRGLGGNKESLLASLLQDLRVTLRSLRRSPGFTSVALLTLTLGIGANTAIFSVVDGVLLRSLPYPEADRLVRVSVQWGRSLWAPFSVPGYWHFANNNRSFESFGALWAGATNRQWPLTQDGPPVQVDVAEMTASAFEVIGTFPQRGRFPSAEEDVPDGPAVALISDGLWVNRYGSDPSIIGRTIELNGITREVIGVMPAGYDFPNPESDVWIPYQLDPGNDNSGSHYLFGIARLASDVTLEAAITDGERLLAGYPELGYGSSWLNGMFTGEVKVQTLKGPIFGNWGNRDQITSDSRKPLPILLGTVMFVLLIACSNVANLLLVRAESQTRERAVRMALGSGRGRLIQYVMTESLLLSLTGGAAGILLAYVATRTLVAVGPASIPRLGEIGINGDVLLFTAAISVLAGLLLGVLPALRAGSKDVFVALGDGARGSTFGRDRHHARSTLIVVQVALVLVLLVGSGLMVRSFRQLVAVDPGFDTERLMTFSLSPPPGKYPYGEPVAQLYDQLVERLEAIPGATFAGGVGRVFNVSTAIYEFPVPSGEPKPTITIRRVTPGYFETMGIQIVEGRAFHPDDHNLRLRSLIISESIKQQYWPDVSALGKEIESARSVRARIVGVVGDVQLDGLDVPAVQTIYAPMLDADRSREMVRALMMTVRTDGDPNSLMLGIRAAVEDLDPDLPIAGLRSMEDVLGASLSRASFTMTLLVLAAVIALFLGSVGIYGVLAYVVGRRTGEIGIRMALGARAAEVSRMVVRQGGTLVLVGLAIGLTVAFALTRVMETILFDVSPTDPATYVAVTVLLLAVGLLASYLPARRAAMVDPVEALRAE